MVTESTRGFSETYDTLLAALEGNPAINVVAKVDHKANALIVFGNPDLGTPLMARRRTTGIDLPQKFLVHEDATGDVSITWNTPRYVARRHGVRGERRTLRTIGTALHNLATAAANP